MVIPSPKNKNGIIIIIINKYLFIYIYSYFFFYFHGLTLSPTLFHLLSCPPFIYNVWYNLAPYFKNAYFRIKIFFRQFRIFFKRNVKPLISLKKNNFPLM
nr:MAG TPA: hypothetical protein [Caudoviricetes sp.]